MARLHAIRALASATQVTADSMSIPPARHPVVYLIESPRTGKHYIGCTIDMGRRLRQHRSSAQSIAGALNTHAEVDWVLVAYIQGFPFSPTGYTQVAIGASKYQRTSLFQQIPPLQYQHYARGRPMPCHSNPHSNPQALAFEHDWQQYPMNSDRILERTVDIGRHLVAQRQTQNVILTMESCV